MRSGPGDAADPLRADDGPLGPPAWRLPSTDGVTVAVHDLGRGAAGGRPILAAHATGFHGLVWRPFADAVHTVRPELAIAAVDQRGHGASHTPRGLDFDWDGFADDVLAVVDGLALDRPLGVGHSMGGAALLRAEVRRPGTFRAIWCFEPIVFPPHVAVGRRDDNPLAAGAQRRRRHFGSFAEARANFAAKPPLDVFHPEALTAYVLGGFAPEPDGTVQLRCAPEVEAEIYRMGTAHDTFVHLPEVTCPVVVACGHDGPLTPAGIAPAVAAELPDGRLHRFDHVGHFGPLEDPAGMAADVVALADAVLDAS